MTLWSNSVLKNERAFHPTFFQFLLQPQVGIKDELSFVSTPRLLNYSNNVLDVGRGERDRDAAATTSLYDAALKREFVEKKSNLIMFFP